MKIPFFLRKVHTTKSGDKYLNENYISEKDYLDCVNSFWNYWQLRNDRFPLAFKAYLSESALKKRLVYSEQTKSWHLIKLLIPKP